MKNIGSTYINYTYAHEGHDSWLSCFPTTFPSDTEPQIHYQNDVLKSVNGIHEIEPGLSYRLTSEVLQADHECSNQPCDSFNLIVYFYEFKYDGKMSFNIGKSFIENEGPVYRAIILTNSKVPQQLSLKKGTSVKGVAIMLSEAWLSRNLRNVDCEKYQQICRNELILDYLTAKHQKIINDIFFGRSNAHLPVLFTNSRISRLVGNFLENLFTREVAEIKDSITPKDFQSVLKIETLLLQSYDEGFPKIENLARMAFMSESKLKKLYKRAFGMGLYEYYQKNRMHKAKELLHSGKYTISQVGSMLGYQNLSNFSASFKKEFNFTPSDFIHGG
jgi:AraC-like DNA-binding protein